MFKHEQTKVDFATHLDRGDYDAVFPIGGTLLALAVSLATLTIAV